MLPRRLLGLTAPEGDPADEGVQLVRVTGDAEAVTPERFLAHAPEAPRTFWQQDDSWRAGLGQAARIAVRGDPPGVRDRYEAVEEQADAIQGSLIEVDGSRPPRFHGGFGFHPDHEEAGAWRGFPQACFVLPAVELVHDNRGTRVNVTVRVDADLDREEAVEAARERLSEVQDAMGPQDPRERSHYKPPTPQNSTDRADWRAAVERVLEATRDDDVEKVVLARTVDAEAEVDPDPTVVLGNLRQANPGTNLFLFQPGPGQAFLGAAPELIGDVSGSILTASAVAGSIPRGEDEAEDDELARELASSDKDRAEHSIVVDSMRRRLARLADRVQVGRDTSILRLSGIQHLEREIYGRLPPRRGILDALRALHPTPAVCGHPRERALELISEIEPFERGWYAGPVGWFDTTGDGAFAPGLRCAVLQDRTWRLFAGAGIVDASTPEAEWEETRVKFEPVLNALGVREAPR